MPFKIRPTNTTESKSYNGIHYDLLGRIGDIARRGFYPQEAATLKKDEVKRLNIDLERIAERMESVNKMIDVAAKRAAAKK
jgi:hypothetical protein